MRRRPEMPAPQVLPDLIGILLAQPARRDALEAIGQRRYRKAGWVVHVQRVDRATPRCRSSAVLAAATAPRMGAWPDTGAGVAHSRRSEILVGTAPRHSRTANTGRRRRGNGGGRPDSN
jgi:hypothetical protein